MTPVEVEHVVDRAVYKTLTALGIDISSPESIIQAQVDFAYLRRLRRGSEEISKWTRRTLVTAAVLALLGMLWVGFQDAIRIKILGG